jgi:hypothetical protein
MPSTTEKTPKMKSRRSMVASVVCDVLGWWKETMLERFELLEEDVLLVNEQTMQLCRYTAHSATGVLLSCVTA